MKQTNVKPKPRKTGKASAPPTTAMARVLPKLKKDGSPLIPWAEEVKQRLEKKKERESRPDFVPHKGRICKAMTTGVHGPKRPCGKWAVNGLTVCATHGGSSKMAKDAATKRLLNELDPTISRLIDIRDQNEHIPSALGAATHIMNRVMGKPDAVDKDKGAGKPTIIIGLNIGGIPAKQITNAPSVDAVSVEEVDDDSDTPTGD